MVVLWFFGTRTLVIFVVIEEWLDINVSVWYEFSGLVKLVAGYGFSPCSYTGGVSFSYPSTGLKTDSQYECTPVRL
ncbi:hypothetical protein EWB00_001732 [Schistosoma japonicum]|uniref:Uncharacterized protein n=1 Tax=Schistosoma japonicum TaxID=6182 RepID=A0A4Z2DES9_SCHJA|nr:hypothetical protein EWB00_001732 [Schistosoma japonicum]